MNFCAIWARSFLGIFLTFWLKATLSMTVIQGNRAIV